MWCHVNRTDNAVVFKSKGDLWEKLTTLRLVEKKADFWMIMMYFALFL